MPRLVKKKDMKGAKKKNNYAMPESIPFGEVLTDVSGKQWKIGSSIGSGGFGEIYMAGEIPKSSKKTDDYNYVVKIEPHANGPLFVEMHFYMRNARIEQITAFCKKRGIKTIGMPYLIGSGSHEINGIKHRFIVIPRYGKDVWSFFLANNRCFPEHTVYRLALQMLDVYEYIHDCTYVHGDLKGSNILLGFGKGSGTQAYLVDFGLASHYTTKDYKLDPKKMHNGTIEYTSRDAHNGVPTMRGDLEILGFNLVHWLGSSLPWEKNNLLTNPVKVQKSKEEFMKSIDVNLKQLFGKNVPDPLKQYLKYVESLQYDQKPDYDKCRKIFETALRSLGESNLGELEFVVTKGTTNSRSKTKAKMEISSSSEEEISDSPTNPVPKRRRSPKKSPFKQPINSKSPLNIKAQQADSTPVTSKSKKTSPIVSVSKTINMSSASKPGKTIINDNLTPNPQSAKTYEFNLELDVSMDANVIVNVRRKRPQRETDTDGDKTDGTPVPRVRIRKLNATPDKNKSLRSSKRTK